MLINPLCIAGTIDFVKNKDNHPAKKWIGKLLSAPIFLFGFLSLLMGVGIVIWCLYNIFISRLPEYSGPELWEVTFGGFGISGPLIYFGLSLIKLALKPK